MSEFTYSMKYGSLISLGGEEVCENIRSDEDGFLLAAAPEMLELLEWLVDIEGPQPGHSEWASRVNSVIAKALGESK